MQFLGILVHTLGGLGMFILGMKMMTEGLQATAGQKIRRILEAFGLGDDPRVAEIVPGVLREIGAGR